MHTIARRWPTVIALALAALTFLDGRPAPEFLAGVLAAMPLFYLLFGVFRGELRRPGVLAAQLAGLVGFAAVALSAVVLNGILALLVLAAGWLGHAVWDAARYAKDRVAPRQWSEWCGVFDVCGALALLLAAAAVTG
ncbi:hypothetical protein [Streptomyces virginiae]|uniref:hypothetical protein n=1 Tax=Streptomyces virginiae TaxID=1961 RepID=UPI002DBF7E81|nr:hypothetical protein [Streptomyces sp. CMAA1738]MEC4573845.1 hypothetical protein [Streptomyces sp. CMAA1738]